MPGPFRSDSDSMIPYSDPVDGLDVPRADLAQALKIAAGLMSKRAAGASLCFEEGWLYIESGEAIAKAPARGVWPVTIVVGASWVRRLARSIPSGDPVRLHIEDGRLYANRYSEPCVWTPVDRPVKPELPAPDEKRLILEAATVLKPLLVGWADLEALVVKTRARGPAAWRQEEKTMITLIARAWEILAPFGVETADIRKLVDRRVRNAWSGSK